MKKFDPNLGKTVKKSGKWVVRLLISLIMVFLVIITNAYHSMKYSSFLNDHGVFEHSWKCKKGSCVLFLRTPNGIMYYSVPPQIQKELTKFYSA